MHTPRPYRESRRGDTILREFRGDVDTEDLIWHQDKSDRQVTVVEGRGWSLQMQDGLPFTLVEGNTYDIPARTWHRLIRGQGGLRVKILETDMRITESQLRKIVREEILREAVHEKGIDDKKPVTADVLQGMKSTPKKKKFKNMAAYEKWADSEDAENYTVQRVYSESRSIQMTESQLLEATLTADYQGKTYKASPGVVALLKKYNWDGAKAIADGKFDWAKKRGINPWSLIQAATIVGTGKPIARKPREATSVLESSRRRK